MKENKTCSKCGEEKPATQEYFNRNKSRKDGFSVYCKVCKAEQSKQYRQANREAILERHKQYYQANREAALEQSKQYRQANREEIAERHKQYYQANREEIAERKKQYYQANREAILEQQKPYRQANREAIAEYNRQYRQANLEEIIERNKQYNQANREEIAERKKQYYQANREALMVAMKQNYQAKNAEQPACVYQIVNNQNGRIYVGETTRGDLRWKEHLTNLRGNRHENKLIQEDFNKFGEEAFEWSIIKELPKNKQVLLCEEIRTISSFLKEGKNLYNLALTIDQLIMLQESENKT